MSYTSPERHSLTNGVRARQSAGNEPGSICVTRDTSRNDVNAWFQSLPKSFPDSSEGFVEDLIFLCRELFTDVRRTVGSRQGHSSLREMHRSFALWNDQKDHLNEKLDKAPRVRADVVCDLVFLIIILSQGLLPDSQLARLPETRRLIEQASKFAGEYVNQSERYQKLRPEEYINAAGNAIQSRLDNLWMLSPRIDAQLVDTLPESYDEAESMNAREDNVLTRDNTPRPLASLRDKLPNASDGLISRYLPANRQRRKNLSSIHAEVDILHNSSNGSDDVESDTAPTSLSSHDKLKDSAGKHPCLLENDDDSLPAAQGSLLDFPKYKDVHKVSQLCACMSQALRRMYNVFRRKDQDFNLEVMVWDPCGQRFLPREVSLDTQATDNLILGSVVDDNNLKRHPLKADNEGWETVNGHTFSVKDYVVPRWHFSEGKKRFYDIRFLVVDKMPLGVEMLLGNAFIKSQKVLSLDRHVLVVHRKKAGTVTREEHQQNSQKRDNNLYEAERQAAIKAQRDMSQSASSQITQTATLGHQSSQKNQAQSGVAQQK